MPKKETRNTENSQEKNTEKIKTKYDLKMERREAEKAKAKRDKKISAAAGIIIVAALACLVLSFPIRTYLTVHESYIRVGGQDITKVEFDYNYNVAANAYINQYGGYMSMFGMDVNSDWSTQMFSEELSLQDYFEQLAAEAIAQNKALLAKAEAEGFVYDTSEDFEEFKQMVKDAAAASGISEKELIRQTYGDYATLSRISDFVKEELYVSAYYDTVAESLEASDEEAQAYYEGHKDDYDSVDYRVLTVEAQLPEAPTEEQTAAAMAAAKEEAEEALKTVAADGELRENVTRTSVPSVLREWMFDSTRKEGDTTVMEDTVGNSYYVAAFENRYLDTTAAVNVRAVITEEDNGQAILDEWKGGAATEESFVELCNKYNDSTLAPEEGGLFENINVNAMSPELAQWLGDEARKTGDTAVISPETETFTYVIYYIGEGEPLWMVDIKDVLLSESMSVYLEEVRAGTDVEDPKGHLKYLTVSHEDEEAADTQESENTESSGAAESSSAQ